MARLFAAHDDATQRKTAGGHYNFWKICRQARAQATVDAILGAARRLLVRGGREALSTNKVAERAGVSIGSLYQYFPDKEAILAELGRRHVDEARALVSERLLSLAAAPPAEAVRVMVALMILSEPVMRLLFDKGKWTPESIASARMAMGVLATGLFFAAVDYGRVRSDPWLAVVVGALGGMLWPVPWGSGPSTLSSPLEVQLFIASIVSTLVCWFASTWGMRRRERMAPT